MSIRVLVIPGLRIEADCGAGDNAEAEAITLLQAINKAIVDFRTEPLIFQVPRNPGEPVEEAFFEDREEDDPTVKED